MSLDLVILGAGPAGVSAALWARSLAMSARVLESGAASGGQLHIIHLHPDEIPGIESGDGPAIAAAMARQLAASGAEVRFGRAAAEIVLTRDAVVVRDDAGEAHEAGAALIATGVRRRRLDVAGDRELDGRGVFYSATAELDRLTGKRVLIAGGGDAAFENALILAGRGSSVTIAARGTPRSRAEFRRRVAEEPRITVREGTVVTAIGGESRVERASLASARGAETIPVDAVVVKIGVVPNTEWCRNAVALDDDGYVLTQPGGRTAMPRVWAAGDVARPLRASIPAAWGSAAIAVAEIRKRRD